ncbi:MAG: LPS assembly protein LptD [Acidobacteriota bacterium]
MARPQTRAAEEPFAGPGAGAAGLEAPAIRVGAELIEQIGPNRYRFSGDVDIRLEGLRLQADVVEYDSDTHQCRARGNVVLEEGSAHLTGDQVEINLRTRLATILNAYGAVEPELILEAERLEKISENRYRIVKARLTSCTQPTPYWSFHVRKGTLELGGYAHLRNLTFRVGKMPIFYTPYLLWPIKENRASGFLMPQVGYSQRRGAVVNTAFFWAPARNFDSTFFFDYLERDGLGTGLETRWLPTEHGRMRFTGYFLDERIDDPLTGEPEGDRYRFRLEAHQPFPRGWRLLADLNAVSDFDYYLDFERDLRAATRSSTTSTLDLSRSWSFYTLNIRAERREQLLSGNDVLKQFRQPEVELRGRSRQLGRSPFYFSFETSATALERDVSYGRFDAFPRLRAPFRPAPWLQITPQVSVRQTVYTKQKAPLPTVEPAVDESLSRTLLRGDLEIIGPRFSRVFETPGWGYSPRLKNVLEPKLTYTIVPDESDDVAGPGSRVLRFDEIDQVADDIHRLSYSLTSRWFALRASDRPAAGLALPRRILLPGLAPEPRTTGGAIAAPEVTAESAAPEEAPGNPYEFARFTLGQTYSFNRSLSTLDEDNDGIADDESSFSPVSATLRFNPTALHSVNVSASYNILRRTVDRATISADLRAYPHVLSLTWFLSNNLADDQSEVRLFAGTALFRNKLTLALELDVDVDASKVPDQRYRIGYNTQCCGFLLEFLDRDFALSEEREVRFLINLKGVGKLFDLQQGVR